jgi:hypothetical protein
VTRPDPSQSYLDLANQEPVQYESVKKPLLVVLDLNGTLLHRPQKGGSNAKHRPGTRSFIQYLAEEHYIMVWSSAKPDNVKNMCKKLFNKETSRTRIGIWTRENFGLSPQDYGRKVQVYKRLSKIWQNPKLSRRSTGDSLIQFDQTNTVLLDDSREKAASEPFNLVEIDTFEGNNQTKQDTLWQVREYLEILRSYTNVSAYIRENPYKYVRQRRQRRHDADTPDHFENFSWGADDPFPDPGTTNDNGVTEVEENISLTPPLGCEQSSKE